MSPPNAVATRQHALPGRGADATAHFDRLLNPKEELNDQRA